MEPTLYLMFCGILQSMRMLWMGSSMRSSPRCPAPSCLFGIFDGHGGRQVSEYCSQVIPNKVVELCKSVEQANTMAATLVKYAKMNGSKDNVSVMILKF
ncbi:uncharacterized protein LOC116268368 [Nymphaea colorata]|nr:uncharacterized protein LOC116268368 [Nymphaea colorata]